MKSLPEIFDGFSDARKEGFLKVKELKESGKNVVGIFCTYTPKELIIAADAIAVGLCGTSEDPIPAAEKELPRNLCPLIKSSYGFALTDQCPYTYFSDLLVGETTCDGKKKMYELLGDMKPMHIMQLPQNYNDKESFDMWESEIMKLKERMEEQFGVKITDEKIRAAIRLVNEERKVTKEFYELSLLNPPPLKGLDMQKTLEGIKFKFERTQIIDELKALTKKVKSEYEAGHRPVPEDAPRILVTGCPLGGVADKVIKAVEDSGGVVVCYENCGGVKSNERLVDESKDPYEAIAEKYISIPCSVMSPNDDRMELLSEMVEKYNIDGVVEIILQACHTYNVETIEVKKRVNGKHGLPYLCLETDYSKSDTGQILTRIGAFIEMMG
ncbi:Benzoyl-CoA reductase/2-hydroxyglutaryl-CoA dehydratase subunit, BcrC/BadD/HgdB [Peptoclostridium litorale DSM 5388]|uniref:2-hydroxyglutaryl-CoA dehydratase subunit D n=1 Tax=Peptoclostridium litorale DSM 5388 TaxID=1121324 RepID=A0A069RCY6_PEPLI|nr:double-cubane-cluster-containing anaerobic reductase [Peptoclostridium litorale]KDR94896.1 2-hydroxyglutaryl-CoA dehydratase subunit D [Peptoclostridium litorale DSM 5388]SIN95108.1 Benzoyl-CoA reductase/2-hydroxyglutaryl-CoA dehydratase subunit, BcrC/BadD/HgdB [Peptoclostridium litorale DSM 5388]